MYIKSLSLLDFKNYEEAEFAFSPQINCLVGDNGSGKTNILDAIYYLSFCKSYFNPIDSQNIRHDSAFFVLQGAYDRHGEEDQLYCGVKRGQKKTFKRNKKEYGRLADHIGQYPSVIVTPNDIDLIKEGSEVRRKFMDGVISQYNRTYLDKLLDYNRVVLQRNNLLRFFSENHTYDSSALDAWNAQLIPLAEYIHSERQKFVKEFVPGFDAMYASISGGAEHVSLEYDSDLSSGSFEETLEKALSKDRQLRRSTVGIHKDELQFLLGGHPIKKFGSQGQQKSFLIALKLAQFNFIEQATGVKPILLLDDIFDKIDDKRVAALMKLVSDHTFGQIFITDTHAQRIPELFRSLDIEQRVYVIHKGKAEMQPEITQQDA